MFLATLFSVYFILYFQDRCSSSKIPRNLIECTLSTLCLLNSNFGNKIKECAFALQNLNQHFVLVLVVFTDDVMLKKI